MMIDSQVVCEDDENGCRVHQVNPAYLSPKIIIKPLVNANVNANVKVRVNSNKILYVYQIIYVCALVLTK